MISREAVERTIKGYKMGGSASHYIVEALERILFHQDEIDEEKEKQHNKIINDIGYDL